MHIYYSPHLFVMMEVGGKHECVETLYFLDSLENRCKSKLSDVSKTFVFTCSKSMLQGSQCCKKRNLQKNKRKEKIQENTLSVT